MPFGREPSLSPSLHFASAPVAIVQHEDAGPRVEWQTLMHLPWTLTVEQIALYLLSAATHYEGQHCRGVVALSDVDAVVLPLSAPLTAQV